MYLWGFSLFRVALHSFLLLPTSTSLENLEGLLLSFLLHPTLPRPWVSLLLPSTLPGLNTYAPRSTLSLLLPISLFRLAVFYCSPGPIPLPLARSTTLYPVDDVEVVVSF